MTKRDRLLLIVIVGLLIVLPISLLLVRKRLDLRPRAELGNVTLALSPTQLQLTPNATNKLDFTINSGQIQLSGLDVSLVYNPEIIQITELTFNPSAGFSDEILNNLQTGSARIALVARKPTTQLPKDNIHFATVQVTARNVGTSPVEIRVKEIVGFNGIEQDVRLNVGGTTNARVIVSTGVTPTVTLTPGVTPTSTPTSTPTPTEAPLTTPNITFATAFVGISPHRPDLTVRLTVVDEIKLSPTQNVYRPLVSAGPDGKYRPLQSPLPLIGVSPGQGKTILLKGPKHLQNKVANRIELKAGNNQPFDWTAEALKLEPGDLPNPTQNMQQDGVVNAVDVALLIARISSSKAEDLQVADLNYDGVINTNDLSLMIETLSTKYDDEF